MADAIIIPFEARFAADFKRLNVEWLEMYFSVEPHDEIVLSDPQGQILAPGGHIFLARLGDEIVGTCALLNAGDGRFEIAKMSVTPRYKGRGIGRQLLDAAIAQFHSLGGRELVLESNSRMVPALTLYESAGFVYAERPAPSHYERSDVYMVYRGCRFGFGV
jgi:ribosomal protein S18 acetylase RimI-like enzyme